MLVLMIACYSTKNLTECLTMCNSCGLSHYAHDGGWLISKRVPRKVLWYVHIIRRLQQLFISWKTIQYMSWQIQSSTNGLIDTSMSWSNMEAFWCYIARLCFRSSKFRLRLYADKFCQFGFSVKLYIICVKTRPFRARSQVLLYKIKYPIN